MCFYACIREFCDNCGEELLCSTIKKRDCLKKSCDRVVPRGSAIRFVDRKVNNEEHSCHFPLVITTEVKN